MPAIIAPAVAPRAMSFTPTTGSPVNSGPYAKFGNKGITASNDPSLCKTQPGHPIQHRFTNSIRQAVHRLPRPSRHECDEQLPRLHVVGRRNGWRSDVSQAAKIPHRREFVRAAMNNPDEVSVRGNWSDPAFLERVSELNPKLKAHAVCRFSCHGWSSAPSTKKTVKARISITVASRSPASPANI